MTKRRGPKRWPIATYLDGILRQDRVLLSQAITLIESTLDADRILANQLLEACMPHAGKSIRLGITGVPGVGKSTFIDAFGTYLCDSGKRVAVLAIDPSSQQHKGSILGDKTRMNRLAHHPNAYVRPSPTAGTLGGVTRKTRETLLLCEAAGFELIIVETVGVGQSEIAVHAMTDFFLLLLLPNAGDDLQGIKKGIMEMADGLIINKADGAFVNKAKLAKANYAQALRLFELAESGWRPPVMLTSALESNGIKEVWETLLQFQEQMQQTGFWEKRRATQALNWMQDALQDELRRLFDSHPAVREQKQALENAVQNQERPPLLAANELIQIWLTSLQQTPS